MSKTRNRGVGQRSPNRASANEQQDGGGSRQGGGLRINPSAERAQGAIQSDDRHGNENTINQNQNVGRQNLVDLVKKCLRYFFGNAQRTSATATIVIAAVTTIYAIISGWQLMELKKGNQINAENVAVGQRPFLVGTGVSAAFQYQHDQEPRIKHFTIWPTLQNSGNTPAKNLTIYLNYYFPTDPMPTDFSFADLSSVIKTSQVAGPHQTLQVSPREVTFQELTEFLFNRRRMYIYGHVEYDDGFEGTPHHRTKFCWEIRTIQFPPIGNVTEPVTVGIPYCDRGNCIDDECKAQGL